MTERMNGTIKIVPFGPGEAHLQNEILDYRCYICKKDEDKEMVLIRQHDKTMVFACLHHPGVAQEFIKQYKRMPLGWDVFNNGGQSAVGPQVGQRT